MFDLRALDRTLANVQIWILSASILIVPLVVLPESNFVDITSTPKTTILRMLGTLAGGILLSRLVVNFSISAGTWSDGFLHQVRSSRSATFILATVAAVAVISVISTVFSILPKLSLWGRVPAAFEAGEFTFLMYVILSIATFVSYREFHHTDFFWKLIAATALSAGLIGFFQYLGWSPLDIGTTHSIRLTGTNGNPIFFGAMLVVLSPAALGYLLYSYQTTVNENKRYWLAVLAIASFLLALSMFGTASRGPWLGSLAGGLTAIVLLIAYGRSRIHIVPLSVVAASVILAALLITFLDPTPAESNDVSDAAVKNSAVSSTLTGVNRTSTLDLRIRYWKMSAEISAQRDPVPHTNDAPKAVRMLFGYGPDMFRFAGTYFADHTTFTRRLTAAHNDPINRLVEQGLLGFTAWVALWISIAYGCFVLVKRSESIVTNPRMWIHITLVSAFTARFVEQLFGSPTPGGTLVFWILVGALAAMLIDSSRSNAARHVSTPRSTSVHYGAYAIVSLIAIGSIMLAWDKGASYLIANQNASFQYRSTAVTADDAIKRLEQATSLAPDVPRYWNDLAELEHGRAASTDNPVNKSEALHRAYQYDLKAYEANPMEVNSIYKLAFSAWESGNAGYPELRFEAVRLYERLTEIIPSDKLAQERLQTLKDFLSQSEN